MLVGDEFALPGALSSAPSPDAVAADRPEVRAAPDQLAIPQNEHAAVAALHAVEHVDVDGVKPVPHGSDRRSLPRSLHPDLSPEPRSCRGTCAADAVDPLWKAWGCRHAQDFGQDAERRIMTPG